MKNVGIVLHYGQGDVTDSSFIPGMLEGEVEKFRTAYESTGEVSVTGFGVVFDEDVMPAQVGQATGNPLKFTTYELVKKDGTKSYISGKIGTKADNVASMKSALVNKTLNGSDIDKIYASGRVEV